MKDLTKLVILGSIIGLGALVGSIGESYKSRTIKYVGGGIIFMGIG